jgi:hypothetical protein
MSEPWVVDRWLYQTLHGDTTLMALISGVFADVAPPATVSPFLVYSLQDAIDVGTVNGLRIWTRATYQVRIVTDSESYGAIATAAGRVDTLLHRASGTVTGGVVISCVRVEPFRYTELVSGKMYRHLGGFYEIQVQ